MTRDHARLTVLMDAEKKKEFDALCAALGTNASQVVRELIADYLAGERPQAMLPPPGAHGPDGPSNRGN
jgi:hypothetical protein